MGGISGLFEGSLDPMDVSGRGADKAIKAQESANRAMLESTGKNIDFQTWLWGEQKDISEPWREAGAEGLSGYQDAINTPMSADEMKADPGYQFRLDEGMKGIENSAAAKGMQLSGSTLKGLGRYAQDYASNEYDKAYARRQQGISNLYNLAAMGQAAAAGQAQSGGLMGENISQSILAQGQSSSEMYSNIGDINVAQSQGTKNSVMQIGGTIASLYTGGAAAPAVAAVASQG